VTVILTGLFDPRELESQLGAAAELEADVQGECAKMGPIEKVRLFKGHPAGAVSVKFRTEEGAQEALAKMNGRFFGGRRIAAALWDGTTNYNIKVRGGAGRGGAGRAGACARQLERVFGQRTPQLWSVVIRNAHPQTNAPPTGQGDPRGGGRQAGALHARAGGEGGGRGGDRGCRGARGRRLTSVSNWEMRLLLRCNQYGRPPLATNVARQRVSVADTRC
jgi:hypothetical protein